MLVKVGKMMAPIRTITFPHIPDPFFIWPHCFQNGPQDNPLPNHVCESCEMHGHHQALYFSHISDNVAPLASLVPKWFQRQSLAKPFL